MTNFQLKYALLVVFDKIILRFLSTKIIYSWVKLVRLGQKVLKFEFAIEAIIIFVKIIDIIDPRIFSLGSITEKYTSHQRNFLVFNIDCELGFNSADSKALMKDLSVYDIAISRGSFFFKLQLSLQP